MATDIATGWSESVPILVRDGTVVLTALQLFRRQLPFPLRGIDVDNDPGFMNCLMKAWCARPGHQIVLTRSRAYQGNDQAWVKQKNGMLVRRVVGYQRLEGLEAAQVLGSCMGPYGCSPICLSPRSSSKAVSEMGADQTPTPPAADAAAAVDQERGALSQEQAEALRDQQRRTDTVALLGTRRRCQGELAVLASSEHGSQGQAS
jgi:hypothetical protein